MLQVLHLRTVPFENSSVRFREPIELDPPALVDKISRRGRGGFCYELNGAFAALLETVGYRVEHLAARSYEGASTLGPPFDHLALRVEAEGSWLVDVGFGYSFLHPLRFEAGIEQADPMGLFRLVPVEDEPGGGYDVQWLHRDGTWRPHFRVGTSPHPLSDFGPTCWYHRTSPASPFTRGWLCARALSDGWATLDGRHLVVTTREGREDRELAADLELAAALDRWFGVQVPEGVDPDPPAPRTR
jgi:N-hydroxyarylamine O-acetyltransferase